MTSVALQASIFALLSQYKTKEKDCGTSVKEEDDHLQISHTTISILMPLQSIRHRKTGCKSLSFWLGRNNSTCPSPDRNSETAIHEK